MRAVAAGENWGSELPGASGSAHAAEEKSWRWWRPPRSRLRTLEGSAVHAINLGPGPAGRTGVPPAERSVPGGPGPGGASGCREGAAPVPGAAAGRGGAGAEGRAGTSPLRAPQAHALEARYSARREGERTVNRRRGP